MAATIEIGQRVRVTLLTDVIERDEEVLQVGSQLLMPAGTVYEGIVADIDTDGIFDLDLDTGETIGFYLSDSTIQIDVLSYTPPCTSP